tara:strand:- start:195 stop:1331 length:1137 start_codon:yes stop_codon:yes gene_type:complete
MGTTGLTAQAYGARDGNQIRDWLFRSIVLSTSIGLVLFSLQLPIIDFSLYLIGASKEVSSIAENYFEIRVWGSPFALSNIAILGWFIGTQNVRAALISQVFMNTLNILLDLWFVIWLGWGVEGVAVATLISEITTVVLALLITARIFRNIPGSFDLHRLFNFTELQHMFVVNANIFVRSLCNQLVHVTLTAIGARIGDITLAANVILLNFFLFISYGLDAFANAAEALVGEAIGKKSRIDCSKAVKTTTKWAFGFSLIFCLLCLVFGGVLIDLLTTIPEVRTAAREYLPWIVLLPIVAVWAFQFDGIYIGATWSREMRNSMILAVIAFLGSLVVLLPEFSNHGLWAAYIIFLGVRGIMLIVWYPGLEAGIKTTNKPKR